MATPYPPILQPAMQRISELEAQIAELSVRMNAISKVLGLPTDASLIVDTAPATLPVTPNPPINPVSPESSTSPAGTFYCDSLTFVGDEPLFPSNHISDEPMEAVYSLEISGDKAKFKLMDDADAFEFLTGDLSLYIDSVAESDNEYGWDVNRLTTNEPGEAVRTDKGWKITKKAKISYQKEQ